MSARILLIDDHQIVRDGLRSLLREQVDLELVGNAYDSETGWQAVEELHPDLIVMDLDVPGEGGTALTARVHAKFPEIRILILTGSIESRRPQAALAAGAQGYVLKGNGFTVLLDAIRTVLAGRTYLCPDTSAIMMEQIQRPNGTWLADGALSARETEVLKQIANGYSTKEIAFNLSISPKTIDSHRASLMTKLNLTSIAELTKYAIRQGLTRL
jgi:DNA-binding NarL/FixJ family response regulator